MPLLTSVSAWHGDVWKAFVPDAHRIEADLSAVKSWRRRAAA
ncbi:MAG: hypothetical protein J0J15_07515 [Mesorhizobium sp.]|nr:hypothetical protein [Mesorhizobium sp.]